MKLPDVIIFVIAICLLIAGIHQVIVVGLAASYWIFIFSLMLLFLYGYRKSWNLDDQPKKGTKANRDQKNG